MVSSQIRSNATSPWVLGDTSLVQIVESEEPLLSPFEIYPDCIAAHLAANAHILPPYAYDFEPAASHRRHPELSHS